MSRLFIFLATALVVFAGKADAAQEVRGAGSAEVLVDKAGSRALDRIDQRNTLLDGMFVPNGTGQGVRVFVFDSGVDSTHPEIKGRLIAVYNPKRRVACSDHGTAVASAVVGKTLGVARGAHLVDVRIFWCENDSTKSNVLEVVDAMRWVREVQAKPGSAPALINLSMTLGGDGESRDLNIAIDSTVKAGITVVVSAGNTSREACRRAPANSPGTIVVGGSNTEYGLNPKDFKIASSSFGSCVTLYAPGEGVLARMSVSGSPFQGILVGSSFATGYVSGAAALFLEANPNASPLDVKNFLVANATRITFAPAPLDTVLLLFVGVEKTPPK